MKNIRHTFKPQKISAILKTEKDVSHAIITPGLMVISTDTHHRSVIYKTRKEASNHKSDATKPTAIIHLHPLTCELNSNDCIKT